MPLFLGREFFGLLQVINKIARRLSVVKPGSTMSSFGSIPANVHAQSSKKSLDSSQWGHLERPHGKGCKVANPHRELHR